MFRSLMLLATIALLIPLEVGAQLEPVREFKARLRESVQKHGNMLYDGNGVVRHLKGKSANGQMALAFYRMYEISGDERYRKAALTIADRVLADMRATKFGVLPIKEKEKEDGAKFIGGGPPAFGFYAGNVAYVLFREGGRNEDLRYLGRVMDEYPWNELGWWSQDINYKTGEPKVSMDKPSIINKCATMAMATAMLSLALEDIDEELSVRLKQKTDQCVYGQIVPVQEEDGFWHYNLNGNDSDNKDILGYFMLTTHALMELQKFNPAYREPELDAAIRRAQVFAQECIAPMTDPNTGQACTLHTTPNTPQHYSLAREPKRGFQLGYILIGAGLFDEGIRIMDASLEHFDYGNVGMDGVHAAAPSVAVLEYLQE